jgi:hypothetical protein
MKRSRRSHVVEALFAVLAIAAIWLFIAGGGAGWAGNLLAELFDAS